MERADIGDLIVGQPHYRKTQPDTGQNRTLVVLFGSLGEAEEILMLPWMHFVAQDGRSARLVSITPSELMGRNAVVRHSPCRFRMPDRRSGSAGSRSPRAVCAQRELVHPV